MWPGDGAHTPHALQSVMTNMVFMLERTFLGENPGCLPTTMRWTIKTPSVLKLHFQGLFHSLFSCTHTPTVSLAVSFAISGRIAQFLGKAITDLKDFQKFYPRVETLRTPPYIHLVKSGRVLRAWAGYSEGAARTQMGSGRPPRVCSLIRNARPRGSQTQVEGRGARAPAHRSLLGSGTCTFRTRAATFVTHLPCAVCWLGAGIHTVPALRGSVPGGKWQNMMILIKEKVREAAHVNSPATRKPAWHSPWPLRATCWQSTKQAL